MNTLTQKLIENGEDFYRDFHSKLVPDSKHKLIGVRVPKVKNIALSAVKSKDKAIYDFINETHTFYEEFMLHALLINHLSTDIEEIFSYLEKFLPQIDNWAVCDSLVSSLKIFKMHPKIVLEKVKEYLKSKNTYTVRFGLVTLLNYYLDDNFSDEILPLAISVKSENYYVNMAISWLLSVALVKRYDLTIPYLESKKLPQFIHNKALQKAIESYRIANEKKEYLRALKIK